MTLEAQTPTAPAETFPSADDEVVIHNDLEGTAFFSEEDDAWGGEKPEKDETQTPAKKQDSAAEEQPPDKGEKAGEQPPPKEKAAPAETPKEEKEGKAKDEEEAASEEEPTAEISPEESALQEELAAEGKLLLAALTTGYNKAYTKPAERPQPMIPGAPEPDLAPQMPQGPKEKIVWEEYKPNIPDVDISKIEITDPAIKTFISEYPEETKAIFFMAKKQSEAAVSKAIGDVRAELEVFADGAQWYIDGQINYLIKQFNAMAQFINKKEWKETIKGEVSDFDNLIKMPQFKTFMKTASPEIQGLLKYSTDPKQAAKVMKYFKLWVAKNHVSEHDKKVNANKEKTVAQLKASSSTGSKGGPKGQGTRELSEDEKIRKIFMADDDDY